MATASWSSLKTRKADWLRDKKINILVQFSLKGLPDLPGVPIAQDLVSDDNAKRIFDFFLAPQEMGRPLGAPPEVPADRLEALRKGFMSTLADPEFLQAAATIGADIDPVSGAEMVAILERIYAMPPHIVAAAKKAAQQEGAGK